MSEKNKKKTSFKKLKSTPGTFAKSDYMQNLHTGKTQVTIPIKNNFKRNK